MGWGRPSPTRCKYILVRSPPASMPPDGRRKPPPTHAQTASPFEKHHGCGRYPPPPRTKGWARRHESGRGFSGRLEAWMPEASLQGGTCGVPLKPLPGSCTALPPRTFSTPHSQTSREQSTQRRAEGYTSNGWRRQMVWIRSGPVEMMSMGTSVSSSMRARYRLAAGGRSSIRVSPRVDSDQPCSSS